MDFVTAFSIGANVKCTTEEYAYSFIEAVVNDPHNWLTRVSHNFVGQCFRAVGLNFNVSVEEFHETHDQPYRNDNLSYIFNAVPFVLKSVEEFLGQLPMLLAGYGRVLTQDSPNSGLMKEFYNLTKPVPCYLRVVNVWAKVVLVITKNLQNEDNTIDKYLCEPLARLSFSILQGLVRLLPDHDSEYKMLKDLCLKLAVLVRYGIFYEATCQFILKPMLNIFEEHFQLFCDDRHSALIFIYYGFSCETSKKENYAHIYKFLESMLDKFSTGQQRNEKGTLYLRIFTSELITDKYLAIQFETLKAHNSNLLLLATLKYLHSLQRHLVSVEGLPTRFLEQILLVLLHVPPTSSSVSSLAVKLYLTLAQRQYDDEDIVAHILETFLKTQYSLRKYPTYDKFLTSLKNYIRKLVVHFPALEKFKFYVRILNAEDVCNELVLFTAQAMCALFELHKERYGDHQQARDEICNILQRWPALLKRAANQPEARNILYGIYTAIDFNAVAAYDRMLLCDLEIHCLNTFLYDDTLNDAEFSIVYRSLCNSVQATGNEHLLVNAAQTLQDECVEKSLKLVSSEDDAIQSKHLGEYAQCIRCVYALLKENNVRSHQVCDMYETLATQLLRVTVVNDRLALYGYECLAYMLSLLLRERELLDNENDHEEKVTKLGLELRDVCVRELCNKPKSFAQVKCLFCATLVLQIGLQHCLTLNAFVYDALLEQLFDPTLALKARGSTLSCSYVQEMYTLFRLLHACEFIKLPNKRTWKPLLQYKTLTTTPDYISPELEKLISVLIKRRMNIYAHCLPVLYIHISNETTVKKRAASSLAGHLQLIDKHSSAKDAWLLRLYVFMASLELLVKNLNVRRRDIATRQRNHLLSLQHLLPLVATLFLEETHFMNISRLLYSLKTSTICTVDKHALDQFITQVSVLKYRCEDMRTKSSTSGEVDCDLKPQPPGPLNEWQMKAFAIIAEN